MGIGGDACGVGETKDADRGVVEAVHDGGTGSEVIEALGEEEVACVEDGGEDPGGGAEVCERGVVREVGVVGWDVGAESDEAVLVRKKVEEGEEDGEGLLDAENPREGPFAVELDGRERWAVSLSRGAHDCLAGVVAV